MGPTSDIGDIGPGEMASSFIPSKFSRIRSYRCLESAFTIAFIPSRFSPWDFNLGCSSYNNSNLVSPQDPTKDKIERHTKSTTLTYPSFRIAKPSPCAPCLSNHESVFEMRTSGESLSSPRSFVLVDGDPFFCPAAPPWAFAFPLDFLACWGVVLEDSPLIESPERLFEAASIFPSPFLFAALFWV